MTDLRSRLIFGLLGAMAITGAFTWVAVHLAGLLGGQSPEITFGDALSIATRTILHPTDPMPELSHAQLPGTGTYYLAIGLLAGLLLAAAQMLRDRGGQLWTRGRDEFAQILDRGTRSQSHGARWAQAHDLRALCVRSPAPGRLTLGRLGSQLLATEDLHSVIVIGPTGSMKTSGFAVPALLEWRGPVVATSVKLDLLDATIKRRRELGEVMVYDPMRLSSHPRAQWTPLAGCEDWGVAQRRATTICTVASPASGHEIDFWYATAAKLLGTLLFAAVHADATMRDVVRWVNTQERREVARALEASGSELATQAWDAHISREERTRSSIYTTTETAITAFEDPRILASSQHAEITARRLLDGNANTLYLIAAANEQQRLRTVIATQLDDIRAEAYARGASTPLSPALLFILDELANIAPIPELAPLASTGRGQGIQLVSIVQDLAQIKARYGPATDTILNNHTAKLVLPGIADPETLQWVSRVAGDEEVLQVSRTASTSTRDSTTQSSTYRALAAPHIVREQTPGHGLLIYGRLPPAILTLRPWFNDKSLRTLAGT